MNRRIRKKLHRGEFNTLGFEVRATFDPPLVDVDRFFDEWIAFVEDNGLAVGGGMNSRQLGQFVTRIRRGRRIGANRYRWIDQNATEADRELVQEWLLDHGAKTTVAAPLKGPWS
jgi:uncharacterized protein YggL (DUF469 family)